MCVVGLDFGSEFCKLALVSPGNLRPDVVTNDVGNRSSPSSVLFDEKEVLIGEAAKSKGAKNPKGLVEDIRSLLGRTKECIDSSTEANSSNLVHVKDDMLVLHVRFGGTEDYLSPETVLSLLLKKLKADASAFGHSEVEGLVVATPLSFTKKQRESILSSCQLANLSVLQFVPEPAAALVSFGFDEASKLDDHLARHVVVIDIGSSTCDVSVFRVHRGLLQIHESVSSSSISGKVFDDLLADHFCRQFERQAGVDISARPKSLRKLRTSVERLKRVLSRALQAELSIDSLCDGVDFHCKFTRTRLEMTLSKPFSEILPLIDQCLLNSALSSDQIHQVLLIGGSAHIPRIEELIRSHFAKADILSKSERFSPEEAIAYGSALQAAVVSGNLGAAPQFPEESANTLDGSQCQLEIRTTSLPLFIALSDESQRILFHPSTPVPCSVTHKFSACPSGCALKVFEGGRSDTNTNNLVYEALVKSESEFRITAVVRVDGTLQLSSPDGVLPRVDISPSQTLSSLQEQLIDEQSQRSETQGYSEHSVSEKAVDEQHVAVSQELPEDLPANSFTPPSDLDDESDDDSSDGIDGDLDLD